jgi:hypothetical protein
MLRVSTFMAVAIAAILMVGSLQSRLPESDPFLIASTNQLVDMKDVRPHKKNGLKLRHNKSMGGFDIGIFGNSRSLNLTKTDLGLKDCSFFNFSVGGESIRSSILLLERMVENRSAPKVAMVSVDNFEIQMYSNPSAFKTSARWASHYHDIMAGFWGQEISVRDVAKMLWRVTRDEFLAFQQLFQTEYIKRDLIFVAEQSAHHFDTISGSGLGFRSDGSRVPLTKERNVQAPRLLKPGSPQILLGYFRHDLNRLSKLQSQGIKIRLFESLLEPKSAYHFGKNPSPAAAASRKVFLQSCREFGLQCNAMPETPSAPDVIWADATHSPGLILGKYLNQIAANELRMCRS